MAEEAVYWQVLEETQRTLRTDMRFEPMDASTVGIRAEGIVIRKLQAPKPDVPAMSDEILPGLLICPGSRITRPAEEGSNTQEEVHYTTLIQLVASDYEKGERNLRSYTKWLEQVARCMSHYFGKYPITNGSFGCVFDSVAEVTQVVDAKQFVRHQKFVAGVYVTAIALETRGFT